MKYLVRMLLICLLPAHQYSYAANWKYALSSRDDNHYIDVQSLTPMGNMIEFWVKETARYSTVSPQTGLPVPTWGGAVKTNYIVHCRNGVFAIRNKQVYRSDGTVINNLNVPDYQIRFLPIARNSVVDGYRKLVCQPALFENRPSEAYQQQEAIRQASRPIY